jgi:hypothetical protein
VFFVAYQQIENYFLSPRITAKTMELHPAVAFGAAIAGASIAGLIGAFIALPVAAIVQASVSSALDRHDVIDADLTRDSDPNSPKDTDEDRERRSPARRRREGVMVSVRDRSVDEPEPDPETPTTGELEP